MCRELRVPLLGALPLEPRLARACDSGALPLSAPAANTHDALREILDSEFAVLNLRSIMFIII